MYLAYRSIKELFFCKKIQKVIVQESRTFFYLLTSYYASSQGVRVPMDSLKFAKIRIKVNHKHTTQVVVNRPKYILVTLSQYLL